MPQRKQHKPAKPKTRYKLVKLTEETWGLLRSMGRMGDTFDTLIRRILSENKRMLEERESLFAKQFEYK